VKSELGRFHYAGLLGSHKEFETVPSAQGSRWKIFRTGGVQNEAVII
jgi:hypothetical protein